jgi:uncharacterized protein (TIGR02186 family)
MSRTCRRRLIVPLQAGLLGVLVLAVGGISRAEQLVADLSDHLIAITTGFTGTEVVLFGALDGPGGVAVVVRGPDQRVVVRRKGRIAGIWVNQASMAFHNVPSFYRVASNRPVQDFANEAALQRHNIGLGNLQLRPADPGDATVAEIAMFRQALIRAKQRTGTYSIDTGQVVFLGERLFRTNIFFPANVPTGVYTVSVFLFRDGEVVDAQTTPLVVSKIGLGAQISRFAQQNAAAYGMVAIVIAVTAGWLAGAIFRKE